MIGDIVWAVVAGTVLGYLGKLLLPGKQDIPAWATIGAGIVAALLAGLVAGWLGPPLEEIARGQGSAASLRAADRRTARNCDGAGRHFRCTRAA